MATKLYLHAAASTVGGTLPASNASVSATSPTQIADSGTNRTMNPAIGVSQTSITLTTNGTANAQPSLIGRFLTTPLATQTFALTSVGDIAFQIAGSEANAGSNFQVRISLATWRPSTGAVVTRIFDLATNATLEPGTSETALSLSNAAGGTSASIVDQDILVLEVWRDSTVPGATTARTNIIFYDGTTEGSTVTQAAFINFPNDTLKFLGDGYGQAQADIKAIGRGFGQAQADIEAIGQAYGQANAYISIISRGFGQAQAHIKVIGRGFGQALATILLVRRGFAQALGLITRGSTDTTVVDTFTRSVSNGVGTSDVGGAWTIETGATSNFNVNGSALVVTKGGVRVISLPTYLSPTESNIISVQFTISARTTATFIELLTNRGLNPAALDMGFGVAISIPSVAVSTIIAAADEDSFGSVTEGILAGETWNFQGAVYRKPNGLYDIYEKIWKEGTAEPSGWTTLGNNLSVHPTTRGHIAIYTSGSGTETVTYDNLQVYTYDPRGFGQAQAYISVKHNSFAQANALIQGQFFSISDLFTRTTSPGLGTADSGGNYTHSDATQWSTNGSKALLTASDGNVAALPSFISNFIGRRGLEFSIDIKYASLPIDSNTINLTAFRASTPFSSIDGLGISVIIYSTGQTQIGLQYGGSSSTNAIGTYNAGEVWRFKGQVIKVSGNNAYAFRGKGWNIVGSEPGWQYNVEVSNLAYLPGHFELEFLTFDSTDVELDNLLVQDAHLTYSGQAQAFIAGVTTGYGFGQSQAWIKGISRGFGQSNAVINTGITALHDTFTRTIAANGGWGTADSGTAWAAGDTSGYSVNGSQGVFDTSVEPNALQQHRISIRDITFNAQFKTSTTILFFWNAEFAFYNDSVIQVILTSPTNITVQLVEGASIFDTNIDYITNFDSTSFYQLEVESFFTNTSTLEKRTRYRIYKIGASIPDWYVVNFTSIANAYPAGVAISGSIGDGSLTTFDNYNAELFVPYANGQAQADIKATNTGCGQAQADIKAVGYGFGQSQADIKALNYGFGQSNADIKAVGQGYGQSQADILAINYGFGQSQADVKQTYVGCGQSQADIKAIGYGFGQSQADIKQIGYGFGQANAHIKATSAGYGQSNADIKQTYQQYGQSQGTILVTYQQYGQAQGTIKQTYQGYGQSQSDIKQIYQGYGQSQGDIKQTYQGYGQSQAAIQRIAYGFGQAQACIKGNGFGQAQGTVKQTYQAYGQAQGNIQFNGTAAYGQAQGKINAFNVTGCGNAQADIKQIGQGYSQAQATVTVVSVASGQAQGTLVVTNQRYAQAQGTIKATVTNCGQAQGTILQSYQSYAQAQGLIKTDVNNVAQSQAWIKTTYQQYSQAQALITSGTTGSGQAQGSILTENVVSGQAQALIIKAAQYGQAQAVIRIDHLLKSVSTSDRSPFNVILRDRIAPYITLNLSDSIPIDLLPNDEAF